MEIAARLALELEDRRAEPVHLAMVHAGLGNADEAIGWLEKAYEARNSHMLYIRQDAKFDPLRGDGRFVELMRRMGWQAP